MAFDSGDIRVAGNATIHVAPLGTPFPTVGAPITTPWVDLGYVTEDGITATYGREITEIYAMQAVEPVRIIATRAPKSIAFALMQQGIDQFLLAMGGGTVTNDTVTGFFRYTPPDASVVDEKAMVVEFTDGGYTYRFEYSRVQNREGVETKMVREDATTFPVTMAILVPADGGPSFEMVTDDPAYDDGLPLAADDDTEGEPGQQTNDDYPYGQPPPPVEPDPTTEPKPYQTTSR
jgi:hypothetical protein